MADKRKQKLRSKAKKDRRLSPDGALHYMVQVYDLEVRENMHIMNRCGFMLTAIVVVGGLAVSLGKASWIRDLWPNALVVAYFFAGVLVFVALLLAISFLVVALWGRLWNWPCDDPEGWCDQLLNGDSDGAFQAAMRELGATLSQNHAPNTSRYDWLQRSLTALIASVVLSGVFAGLHGLIVLTVLPTTPAAP